MLHHRLTTSKTVIAEHKQKAPKSLFEGSIWLLAQSQAQAGSALGLLAVKHCVDEKVPVTSVVSTHLLKFQMPSLLAHLLLP